MFSKKYLIDLAERVLFVGAYAATSELIVEAADIDQAWAPILMASLAALKGLLAKKVGDPDSAGVTG